MNLVYRKLFDVEIKHDYFLLPTGNFPLDYDISKTIQITPTPVTTQVMKDYKIVFKTTAVGFSLFIAAEKLSATTYASRIDLEPSLVLSFHWTLRNPHFLNFTNQRLKENSKNMYYVSNRSASQEGTIISLNKAIVSFGTTYVGDPLYRLGDIIRQSGETYELIEKESPVVNFPANASKWQKISTSVVNYVNPADRLRSRKDVFRHERDNTNPGEFIAYKLIDADGATVDLGFVMGTDLSQGEYLAPAVSSDRVNHTIDLQHIPEGRYTMEIHESAGLTTNTFYLTHASDGVDLFGVSEFFLSGVGASFQFVAEDVVTKRWMLDATPKKFTIRFRNRLTKWKYLNQDKTVFHTPPTPRPLTRIYSGYEIVVPGGTLKLPDPSVDTLVPEVETELVKNIFSEIFLFK